MALKPFNFFASGMQAVFELDDTFENIVRMLYMSIDPEDRPKFRAVIVDLVAPPVDPEEVDRIWDKSGGAIYFRKPDDTVAFLRLVLEICEEYQRLIDAHP